MAGTTQKEENQRSPFVYPGSAELSQGQTFLNDRIRMLNTIKGQFPLFEALASKNPQSDGIAQKNLTELQVLETNFNKKLSDYSSKYKLFMEEYNNLVKGLASCKESL